MYSRIGNGGSARCLGFSRCKYFNAMELTVKFLSLLFFGYFVLRAIVLISIEFICRPKFFPHAPKVNAPAHTRR